MTRYSRADRILWNLQRQTNPKWDGYMEYEDAHKEAVIYSGLDFGDNIKKWEEWFTNYPRRVGYIYSEVSLKEQCLFLVKNLKGEISKGKREEYLESKHALAVLIEKTGQDFGDDADAWEEWVNKNISEDDE